ncbi:hypothetical protein [Hymenobacter psoromatis]|uniref:hypothetical protein n=1 Tax=Hymenobacter psoromatis TaxID=1484116 RepID=UPI001CBDAFE7|nr:hypothetical protein [Hymenobacter psoromatis]
MDIDKRFDQLESLLVDLARKQDQQAGQIAQIIKELNRQGEAIDGLREAFARQEVRLDNLGEQIDSIINILKLSEARHAEAERRQDAMMAEIQQQSKRQDVAVDALKILLKRQQTTDTRLDDLVQTELQMLQLMRRDSEKLEGHEPRIKRLEDEFLRPAS